MVGNSIEEGVMLQVKNPSHNDPTRFGFLAGAAVCLATFILLNIGVPAMTVFWQSIVSMVLGFVAAAYVSKRLAIRRRKQEEALLAEQRDLQNKDTERRIRDMNAQSGGEPVPGLPGQ